ncbi:MAG: hypothetical protein IJO56_02220 [Oscillospiraceae bacterium]|nr:hypothetical protein [Oscillospiraceae bacterium]
MAVSHNFRSAMGGFKREDVVRYIEYMNTKHAEEIAALNAEMEQLRQKVCTPEMLAHTEELEAKCAELTAQLEQALADKAALEAKSGTDTDAQELDAYRRAQDMERQAKERSEQLFNQAAGALAQATTQVDDAATAFIGVADTVTAQLDELRRSIEHSKNALRDAATTMYGIRPTE